MKEPLYRFKDYQNLYLVSKSRAASKANYFTFEKYQGVLLIRYLEYKGVTVKSTHLLDLGCGFGGYAVSFQEAGARVVGLDLDQTNIPGFGGKVSANALNTPFPDRAFDVVVCASLIEHVRQPEELLQEIVRVLKPGGHLFLSYPPFYSPVGGHQFAPFHLLGERISLFIFKKRNQFKHNDWMKTHLSMSPASYDESFGSWGLYRRTIRWTKQAMRALPFELIDCSTRLLPINTAAIPVLGEFLTWHVQFLARKI